MPIPTPIRTGGDLASILKARRSITGLRQKDIADLNRMSRFTVTDAESGRGDPKLSTVITLLRTLGMTLVAVPSEFSDRVSIPQVEDEELEEINDVLPDNWGRK